MIDAEVYKLSSLKDKVKCPHCSGDVYVLFKHGPLTPGQNVGFAMGCKSCPEMFHMDEVGKIIKN
ncbi:MAG: hypothetical protein JW825_03590 [Candidatus Methanofastidiosa archaeon]|nr:hypothetical protein [Candidatus Methanofastidiosa archaeon]